MLGPVSKTAVLVGLLLGPVAWLAPVKLGIICGHSMQPALHPGSLYLLDRAYYRSHPVRPGDVIVFNNGPTTYVKRVLARGGETVYLYRCRQDTSYELVRPHQLERLRRLADRWPWRDSVRLVSQRVPEGHLFVVGDNLQGSMDSRSFGPIPVESVQGRVLDAPIPRSELIDYAALSDAGG